MIFLPEHFSPSPSNPVLQMHLWDPSVFWQAALTSHRSDLTVHSFISCKANDIPLKITLRFDIIYHCTLSLNVNSLWGTNTRSDYTWLSGSGKSNLNEPGTPKYCSKISQRLLEDCPQIAQRLPTNSPQIAHGLPTECLWISFGLPTWYLLITYELIDRGMLIADGLLTNCSLIAQGLLKDCSRASPGF